MDTQNAENVDSKTIRTWKHHLQEEIDANFLYSQFAQLEPDPERQDILLELADVENRHIERWEAILNNYNVIQQKKRPTLKARFWSWYARKINRSLALSRMLNEEASEVKDYLILHRNSTLADAKETALDLARESALHTESLKELTGTSDEPWHKTKSGGTLGNIVYGFNDGLTANFGLLAGVIGATDAATSVSIIVITGIIGTVADSLNGCFRLSRSKK